MLKTAFMYYLLWFIPINSKRFYFSHSMIFFSYTFSSMSFSHSLFLSSSIFFCFSLLTFFFFQKIYAEMIILIQEISWAYQECQRAKKEKVHLEFQTTMYIEPIFGLKSYVEKIEIFVVQYSMILLHYFLCTYYHKDDENASNDKINGKKLL